MWETAEDKHFQSLSLKGKFGFEDEWFVKKQGLGM
jgi:hypothetical protein